MYLCLTESFEIEQFIGIKLDLALNKCSVVCFLICHKTHTNKEYNFSWNHKCIVIICTVPNCIVKVYWHLNNLSCKGRGRILYARLEKNTTQETRKNARLQMESLIGLIGSLLYVDEADLLEIWIRCFVNHVRAKNSRLTTNKETKMKRLTYFLLPALIRQLSEFLSWRDYS